MSNDFSMIPNIEEEEMEVWTTEKVDELLAKIEEGYVVKNTPFFKGNFKLRKGNISFEYTPEELIELQRCADDIVYFANHYCKVMTDKGVQNIKLRDYQEDMLRHMDANRFSVIMAARQIGKCFFNGKIEIFVNSDQSSFDYNHGESYDINIDSLYISAKKFELLNANQADEWQDLYRTFCIDYEDSDDWNIDVEMIETDYFDRHNMSEMFDENDIEKKIIDTVDISDQQVYVKSIDGWRQIEKVHMTQPYEVYHLILENDMELFCADQHLLFTKNGLKCLCELNMGEQIVTENGYSKVKEIKDLGFKKAMYDITLGNDVYALENK